MSLIRGMLLSSSPKAIREGVVVTHWVAAREGTKHPQSPGWNPRTESSAPTTAIFRLRKREVTKDTINTLINLGRNYTDQEYSTLCRQSGVPKTFCAKSYTFGLLKTL